jgi:hypothetical protein
MCEFHIFSKTIFTGGDERPHMEPNVGGTDRTARLVAGPLLLLAGLGALAGTLPGGTVLGAALAALGVVALATGLARRCLLHGVLGIDTSGR